jgi:sugar porter (SP) family MFS transporter
MQVFELLGRFQALLGLAEIIVKMRCQMSESRQVVSTAPQSRSNWGKVTLISCGAALSGLLFGYDTAVVNGALGFLRVQFGLGNVGSELSAAALLWGCAPGAAIAGHLSDTFGRKRILLLGGILFIFSAIGSAIPANIWQFVVARFFGGVAIGCASLLAPLYIAEIAPPGIRGRLISLNQLAIVIGILVAFLSNFYVAKLGQSSWRWMFGIGVLPAVGLCLSLFGVPESPRWLVMKGRYEDARDVLGSVCQPDSVNSLLAEIGASLMNESGSYRELLKIELRRPMLISLALVLIQQATGINTVLYYGSILFQQEVHQSAGVALSLNILVGIVNLAGTVVAFCWIDRFGRRPLLLVSTSGMAIALLVLAAFLHWHPEMIVFLFLAVLSFVGFFAVGLGSGVWVCVAELFPNRVRGRAMSIATVLLWSAVSVVTASFLSMIAWLGADGVFVFYAMICICSFFYVRRSLPETKGRSLEEIETFWKV